MRSGGSQNSLSLHCDGAGYDQQSLLGPGGLEFGQVERRKKNLDEKGKLRPRQVAAGKDLWQDDQGVGLGLGSVLRNLILSFQFRVGLSAHSGAGGPREPAGATGGQKPPHPTHFQGSCSHSMFSTLSQTEIHFESVLLWSFH